MASGDDMVGRDDSTSAVVNILSILAYLNNSDTVAVFEKKWPIRIENISISYINVISKMF